MGQWLAPSGRLQREPVRVVMGLWRVGACDQTESSTSGLYKPEPIVPRPFIKEVDECQKTHCLAPSKGVASK